MNAPSRAPSCVPVIFGPHITPHCPAAPWWDPSAMTPLRLGWWIAAALALAWLYAGTGTFIRNRWEITCGRPQVVRRWYGSGALVRLRHGYGSAAASVFRVIRWDDEDTEVPWLLVVLYSGTSWRLPEEDTEEPEPSWRCVTDFAPEAVRRFRPHLIRCTMGGRVVLVPWLVKYLPPPRTVRVPQDVSEAA